MKPIISKTEMSALLGRPLTTVEDDNFDLYLKNATETLESLLCTRIALWQGERIYDKRPEFKTVFTDIFTDIFTVTVNGKETTKYSARQFDRRSGKWFNSIIIDTGAEEVTIEADWGFEKLPTDLMSLVSKLFVITQMQSSNVKSKKIEDFSVTYGDKAPIEQFITENYATLRKYGACIGDLRSSC